MSGYVTGCATVYGPEASGEEARAQAQKPDKVRGKSRNGLCLESHPNGGLGSSPKPDSTNHHYREAPNKKRVRKSGELLWKSEDLN